METKVAEKPMGRGRRSLDDDSAPKYVQVLTGLSLSLFTALLISWYTIDYNSRVEVLFWGCLFVSPVLSAPVLVYYIGRLFGVGKSKKAKE